LFREKLVDTAGTVYNAMDDAPKVVIVGAALNEKLSDLKPGKDLVKFSCGLHCGKLLE
jgi:hypothetical protein